MSAAKGHILPVNLNSAHILTFDFLKLGLRTVGSPVLKLNYDEEILIGMLKHFYHRIFSFDYIQTK